MNKERQREVAGVALGPPGRMIAGSKTGYQHEHPGNLVVFNANVCTRSCGKIWFGDLDVTADEESLMNLSVAVDEDVYVLAEADARFETEDNPVFDRAVAVASGRAVTTSGGPSADG